MCEKCAKKARNLKPTLSKGKIRFWASRLDSPFGSCPIFENPADNYAIEAEIYYRRRKATNRKYYSRKSLEW